MITEKWLPIPNYVGLYEVSNLGNVKRVGKNRLLKKQETCGYFAVGLCKEGRAKTIGVHRLVAWAFIGPQPDFTEVNHKNGVRSCNRPENLEYLTKSQNVKHSFECLGRIPVFGERNAKAKATASEVQSARELLDRGIPKKEVANQFGHHLCWAYRLANGQTRLRG